MMPEWFVDMDGVLVEFEPQARRVLGREVGYDITPKEWKMLEDSDRNFWFNLPPMMHSLKLWNEVRDLKPHILTAPGGSTPEAKLECAWQKLDHCKQWLPGFDVNKFRHCRSIEKQLWATIGASPNILIDDYDKNIQEWETAGGIGILHKSMDETVAQVRRYRRLLCAI